MTTFVGGEVHVACVICGAPIDPWKHCCSAECFRELNWRKALVATGSRYKLDPESRLGKLAAQMDAEEGSPQGPKRDDNG